jgi:lipoprotein signal peptidase
MSSKGARVPDASAPAVAPAQWPATGETRSLLRGKLWFWLPIVPLVALDLWSKAEVFAFLAETYPGLETHRRHTVIDGWLGGFALVSWRNPGTIWGLGQSFTSVLIGVRALALFVIAYFAWRTPRAARQQQVVLAMVMAGAIGNLYDNLTQAGSAVRDFVLVYARWPGYAEWPAFNVADACICVGAIALAVLLWRAEPAAKKPR